MEVALLTRLLASAGIVAITTEISWVTRPQATALPAIVMQKVSPDRAYTMAGAGDYRGEQVQFDIWTRGFAAAVALRDALTAEMEAGAAIGEISFSPSFLVSERHSGEHLDGTGTITRISLDFTVWWKASS